ncbi:NUDIX domain-containing protein [Kitasatospora atroaurantiaca]|nr:NUDIX domain-containing protein [Kitasatospora atroaurantiaca]
MPNPPARRVGGVVIAFNEAGDVLMVDPNYKDGWILPGGSAEKDEAPNEAAARHLLIETGLVLDLWELVAVDYAPVGEYPEGLNFVFNGGILKARQVDRIKTGEHLNGHRFVPMTELHEYAQPYQRQRIGQAWEARRDGKGLPLLIKGEPVG